MRPLCCSRSWSRAMFALRAQRAITPNYTYRATGSFSMTVGSPALAGHVAAMNMACRMANVPLGLHKDDTSCFQPMGLYPSFALQNETSHPNPASTCVFVSLGNSFGPQPPLPLPPGIYRSVALGKIFRPPLPAGQLLSDLLLLWARSRQVYHTSICHELGSGSVLF
ncbi:hypothetical protein L209DRAFT_297742 [Thermothelomyces heterothallicus CBS 203.75]